MEGATQRFRSKGQAQVKSLVPAEGNFEEHPYFRVGDRNAGAGILEYHNELRTAEGNVLNQSWTVRAAHGRGLPGRFDQDVYVALLQLIDERGMPDDGWIGFSLYELMDLMNRSHSGRDYQQVRESLKRMASTTIESENAFYHRGKKKYLTETFSLLSEVKTSESEGPNGERGDGNWVHLSKFFVESYQSNYLKNLDSALYWSLSSPIAKRLYRLIDKKRSGKQSWEMDLFSLRDRIPLSTYKYASKIKEKLKPAHDELISKDFLEDVVFRKSTDREKVIYRVTESFRTRRASVVASPRTEEELLCIQRLRAEGVDSTAAERLVSTYGRDRVMHYVDALPYQKHLRNPAGWLHKAITNNYDLDLPPSSSPLEENKPENRTDPAIIAPLPTPDPEAEELWAAVRNVVSKKAGGPATDQWFDGTVAVSCSSGYLELVAPNSVAREYLSNRFKQNLEDALAECSSSVLNVSIS